MKKVDAKLYLEKLTLHDKDSYFRAKRPVQYMINVCAQLDRNILIIRTFSFETKAEQTTQFKHLEQALGL